jgi:hypothetical protein
VRDVWLGPLRDERRGKAGSRPGDRTRYHLDPAERLSYEAAFRQCLRCESPLSRFRDAIEGDLCPSTPGEQPGPVIRRRGGRPARRAHVVERIFELLAWLELRRSARRNLNRFPRHLKKVAHSRPPAAGASRRRRRRTRSTWWWPWPRRRWGRRSWPEGRTW